MKKFFYGIGKKFLLSAIGLIALAVLAVTASVMVVINRNEIANMEEEYASKTRNIYYAFDAIYKNLDGLTDDLILNDYIQKTLGSEKLSATDREMLLRSLSYMNNEYIQYYYYLDNKRNFYSQKNLVWDGTKFHQAQMYEKLQESYAKTHLIWADAYPLNLDGYRLMIGRNVQPLNQSEGSGVLYLVLKDSLLEDVVLAADDSAGIYFVLDDEGTICYQSEIEDYSVERELQKAVTTAVSEVAASGRKESRIHIDEGILCCKMHEDTGFVLVSFVPNAMISQVMREITTVILLVVLVVLLGAFFLSSYLSKRLSRPIKQLNLYMTNFSGESLHMPIHIETNTELDSIGESYNAMLGQIDELLTQVKQQQEHLKNAQMQTLMYQVHPHFLYNTLGNIHMLARLNGETTIAEMIGALSTFLRLTLNNGKDFITLKDELEHVKSYLDIMRIRNDDVFRYEVDCEDGLLTERIIKLILQPLVENAIKHGFAEMDAGGIIKVSICLEDEYLHLAISDNGAGIPPDVLNRINRLENNWDEPDSKMGVGIRNVVYRLKIQYHEKVHFSYESEQGWTTGHIRIHTSALVEWKEDGK